MRFRPLVLCAALALGADASADQPLTLAARVWGLAKYHHPDVTACRVDWDAALIGALPPLESAGDTASRDAALSAMLAAAGPAERRVPDAETPSWIVDADVSTDLRERLAWLAAQRPQRQCYVASGPNGQATFDDDASRSGVNPDRARRALGAFRFWNAIEYFFPYKADIGRDWAGVLDEHLPRILDAGTQRDYILAMRAFTAQINDSHAYVSHAPIDTPPSAGQPPFRLRLIEGRDIVSGTWPSFAGDVRIGDELRAINGESFAAIKAAWRPRSHGSNPAWFEDAVLRNALSGPATGSFRFRRPNGSEYTASLSRRAEFGGAPPTDQPVSQRRALPGGCTFGIVDLGKLQGPDVARVMTELRDTDAIVFDVRNYPDGTLWPIVDRLYDARRSPAHFEQPVLSRPGTFERVVETIGGAAPNGYRGRILVLHDERSISQSEYTVMGLQATGRAMTFGSQTAGADGNITQIMLPGALQVTFTGLGVYYPDGRETQRIGMVPDVHVTPTIAGLAAGRDEVLDAALDCRWRDAAPPPRLPPSGLYFASTRDGEGLDVHRDANTAAILSYGFDAAGEPEWLLSAAPAGSAAWSTSFHRHGDGGATATRVADYAADFQRGPYAPACAIAEQHALGPRARWTWPGSPDAGLCQLPLLYSGASPATGLWAGPDDDAGWGLSVHHAGTLLTVIAYAYGADGTPRWLLGQAQWTGSGTATLPLQRMRGYCRTCAPGAVERIGAGTLQLNLDGTAPWATLDAEFSSGTHWQRTRMPLRKIVGADRATSGE